MKILFLLFWCLPPLLLAQIIESTFDPPVFRTGERLWGQGPEGAPWMGAATDVFEVRASRGIDNSGALFVNPGNLEFQSEAWTVPAQFLRLTPDSLPGAKIAFRFSIRLQENQGDTFKCFISAGQRAAG